MPDSRKLTDPLPAAFFTTLMLNELSRASTQTDVFSLHTKTQNKKITTRTEG